MTQPTICLIALAGIVLIASCDTAPNCSESVKSPIDTRVSLVNLARELYVTARIREHRSDDDSTNFTGRLPLLPPGAVHRASFADVMDTGCPGSIDVEILLYQRVNDDTPIGDDTGEEVIPTPVAAGRILNVPACCVQAVETYTIVNWEPENGVYRVKFAQGTAIDVFLNRTNRFPNADDAWEFAGIDPAIVDLAPPSPAPTEAIQGRVVETNSADNAPRGVANIGVLIRTRFRVRLGDNDLLNDPDDGFSDPIDFDITGPLGAFSFARPAGAYRVEFFSDVYAFRPDSVDVESPNSYIEVLAEPLSEPFE